MAGPGIRYFEMARFLHPASQLTLAAPVGSRLPPSAPPGLHLVEYDRSQENRADLYRLASQAEIIILQGDAFPHLAPLKKAGKYLVIDLYDPFTLENLQVYQHEPMFYRQHLHAKLTRLLAEQLALGDFFICGSEKQRDYWLGALTVLHRINPLTNLNDPQFRKLIDLVSFGIVAQPPVSTGPVLKGVHPGIAAQDMVLIWGGGLWEWFDPLTLLKAMSQVVRQRPDIKLFFMGIRHPNPTVPLMKICQDTLALSAELGLTDHWVFFADWTPYHERVNYLLEADIGVSLHLDQLETRFSLRTRLFDYIWAGLPTITTAGDVIGEMITGSQAGYQVAERDVTGVVKAILQLASVPRLRETYRPVFERLRASLSWPVVLTPLLDYCASPYHAADYNPSSLDQPPNRAAEIVPPGSAPGAVSPQSQTSDDLLGSLHHQSEIYLLQHQLEHLRGVYNETVEHTNKVQLAYDETSAYARNLELALSKRPRLLRPLTTGWRKFRSRKPQS